MCLTEFFSILLQQDYFGYFYAKDLERPNQIVCVPTELPAYQEPLFLGWAANRIVSCNLDDAYTIPCRIFDNGRWDDLFTYETEYYYEETPIFQVDQNTLMFLGFEQIVFLDVPTGETRVAVPDYQPLSGCLVTRVNETHLIFTGGNDDGGYRQDTTYFYDLASDEMTPGPQLRVAR